MTQAFKYRAFLSYSHADTRAAKRVHGRLEGFHIDKDLIGRETSTGSIPETLRPIFRDRLEFDAGGSLAEQTIAVLDGSAALIVLASPHAARSKYVNEELRQFKSRYPKRPVIPMIVDGEPGDPEKECFPPALRFSVTPDGVITNTPVDVLAADLREKSDGIDLALAKVVARLIGLPPDDVYRRADRERRRQARGTRRVQALIYLLLVGIIAGLVGWINQAYIEQQWRWYTVTRPYMVSQVRPYVLTAAKEQALKPGDSFKECATDCPEMVVVPAGSFMMGWPTTKSLFTIWGDLYANKKPQHNVTIAKPFAVSKFALTFAGWDACAAYGDCDPHISSDSWGRGQQPVINVTWDDAKQYVAWLSQMTGKTYRLLSEAEYEYAARAGTQTAYPWGDDIGKNNANCNGCGSQWDGKQPAPVGSFEPNRFGLYDMVGNVWAWVEDCWHGNYDDAPADGTVWTEGGNCKSRVVRGGGWDNAPLNLRAANRDRLATDHRVYGFGIRVARTLTP
jgi:formylglycine-generating enzyme required for sulfatase activity